MSQNLDTDLSTLPVSVVHYIYTIIYRFEGISDSNLLGDTPLFIKITRFA